jgi:cell division protein FtsA
MSAKNFEVYFDCGTSKIRACALNKDSPDNTIYCESNFFQNQLDTYNEIQKIIISLEKKTGDYLNDVNLMIDSPKMISIDISISKKLDGSKLKKEDIKFLVQDTKQQILRNYHKHDIVHIIIKNYKIDNKDYLFLPNEINSSLISLDILFICLPKETIDYLKKDFLKLDISINQIFCSSYVKSINYKDSFFPEKNLSFIDIGFNKTSLICYKENKITSFNVLPIGSNHITKDISKVLKINLQEAENVKLFFDKNRDFLSKKKISIDLVHQIILARIEEILELCSKSQKLNLGTLEKYKIVLLGEGSKVMENEYIKKISLSNDLDLLEETADDFCLAASKLLDGLSKQEVVIVPKKQIKQGFFEKLFHFFK